MSFGRKSEINDLDFLLILIFKHNILQFNIPMTHALQMQIMHCQEYGMQNPGGLLLTKTLQIGQQITEIAALTGLHHQMKLKLILEDLIELHDIRVVQILHHHKFVQKLDFVVVRTVLVYCFYCDGEFGDFVLAQTDVRVFAGADYFRVYCVEITDFFLGGGQVVV